MKRTTLTIIDEYNNVLTGHVSLYSYRLLNLCIKADPISLLGVAVDIEGLVMNIEDVAYVAQGEDEYQMKVVPKDEKNLLIVGKGIAEEHAEFKQESDTLTLDDGTECRYIRLIMPEVNEDRRKFLTDAVKVLHDECAAKIKACNTYYTGKIAADVVGQPSEVVDEVNKKMQETKEMYDKICEDVTATKNSEIDEAYTLYVQKQQEEQTQQSEQAAAEGKESVSKLKIQ